MTPVLQLNDVSKRFAGKPALDRVTLALPGDSYISLLGASGSGKTTLLRVIAGFDSPEEGTVLFQGEPIDDRPAHERGIGFVFQNFGLFPHLNVRDNIAFGLKNRTKDPVRDEAVLDRRCKDIIALVGLSGLERRSVTQISGGQRQRVALARTLVTDPRLVLLDEPLGALDAHLRARMRDELREIRKALGVTFLHVTGSESEALAMGDRLIVLDAGRVAQFGAPADIYAAPSTPRVAHFLNAYNLFEGRRSGEAFVTPLGSFPIPPDRVRAAPGTPSYAVRHDRIVVRDLSSAVADDEVTIPARFVATEYAGASVLSFFALDGGQVVEVEQHLSRADPPEFEFNARYGLVWNRDAAIVYA